MKSIVKQWLERMGLEVRRHKEALVDALRSNIPQSDCEILLAIQPYTMTSVGRLLALIDAVRYVARNAIAGDLVECGVWRGGSMMAAALTLLQEGDATRQLYLYDTFEGMSAPSHHDRSFDSRPADQQLEATPRGTGIWCEAGLDDVRANVTSTGYPAERLHFVQGKVEATMPGVLPERVALLRLDTDWYESTKHELVHAYPRLAPGGVLIIDDYGHWQGARKATDEYFAAQGQYPLLQRIDYTGRLLVKT